MSNGNKRRHPESYHSYHGNVHTPRLTGKPNAPIAQAYFELEQLETAILFAPIVARHILEQKSEEELEGLLYAPSPLIREAVRNFKKEKGKE